MLAPARPVRPLALFVLILLTGTISHAAAPPVKRGPLTYEGTWRVIFSNQRNELTLWLLKIDATGKKISVVSGLNDYGKFTVRDVKAEANALSFTMAFPAADQLLQFELSAMAPTSQSPDTLRGTAVEGGNLLPIWLQRTTLKELTQGNASRDTPGFTDVMAALKQTDPAIRLKQLRDVATKYSNQPIQFLALQAVLTEYVRQKADAAPFREVVATYRKAAALHGNEYVVGVNLQIARNLLDYPPALPVALDCARESVKLSRPEYHIALRFSAQLTLAAALHKSGKGDEIKPVLAEVAKLGEQSMQKIKGQPNLEIPALQQLAMLLLGSPAPSVADLGLEWMQRSTKMLKDDMPATVRTRSLRLLEGALVSRGKEAEAKKVAEKIEQLELDVDREYQKDVLSFKIEPYKGRKGGSERVALVELFTGAQYKPAVAASIAYDACLQRYSPKEVAFLQYHVASPEPDVLMNRDAEMRKTFYKGDLDGVPAMFVDGKLTPALGGAKQRGPETFDLAKKEIDAALETELGARIKLDVTRRGDSITASATVTGLKEPSAKVRLRFALTEEVIRYTGASGIRLHHHVVRAFIGGDGGFRLEKPEMTQSATIILPQLRKQLDEYVTEQGKKIKVQWLTKPLALTRLKVVAFVQDEDSKQVHQAAQADVPGK